jgi:minor histocompatibility antigen H13
MTSDPPKYSILGLGDIVIPGIFVSMCLRYDFLKTINRFKFNELVEGEKKGEKKNQTVSYLIKLANESSKTYFVSCLIGYLIAIITTVIVMIIFEHG